MPRLLLALALIASTASFRTAPEPQTVRWMFDGFSQECVALGRHLRYCANYARFFVVGSGGKVCEVTERDYAAVRWGQPFVCPTAWKADPRAPEPFV